MPDLAAQLDRLYTLTKESQSEPEFYVAVYQYCDLIMKNPVLREILDESEREYTLRHREIWSNYSRTDEEATKRHDMTVRLERFNLFCDFTLPMMRIYYPLDDYMRDPAPEYKQDPAAVVMMRGLKAALKYKKWDKDTLRSFDRWYNGNRSMYETNLLKFHTKMLAKL